jgi:diguanylate cyclase (GGDEF)-like protein
MTLPVSVRQVIVRSTETDAPILVVDDDAATRALVAIALRRAGFDVLEAASGEAALGLIEGEAVGLVVLDLSMPGMSGIDVVRALRERPQSATLPIILLTGKGDEYALVPSLGAGADDYLTKPVRLDELVARVRAHLRRSAAWSSAVEEELHNRLAVVEAFGHLTLSPVPEEAAEAIVAELERRTACDFTAVSQLVHGDRLRELATYNRIGGVRRGGALLGPNLSRNLVARSRQGPWVEDIVPLTDDVRTAAFSAADITFVAGAPIYAGDKLVGLLSLGVSTAAQRLPMVGKAGLLAATIDYASILSVVAGPALADQREMAEVRSRLEHVLTKREFHPVFQPIVDLESREIVGYEALTRFTDGIRPDLRFTEAASVGLGPDYELAAIEAALTAASHLPEEAFLTLNVSPGLVLESGRRLRKMIGATRRRLILELTEHVPIHDYAALREAIRKLGDVGIAVDDAGAGYTSLRHILELRPTFAKLDISLVRGIEADELRQALAAGLDYFSMRSGFHLIAEGVETEDEATALRRLGVEFAQGYLVGRPAPAAEWVARADVLSASTARDDAATERDTIAGARDETATESAPNDGADAARERARLEKALRHARLDDLTGLDRRKIGRRALTNEIDRARRGDGRFVVAFVDVDGLKQVNDRDGHAAGDHVLRTLAAILRSNVRSFDPIVRYGGDEFVCGLSGVDPEAVERRFGAIDQALQDAVGVGITVGLASLLPNDTLDKLIARADAALLDGKRRRDE